MQAPRNEFQIFRNEIQMDFFPRILVFSMGYTKFRPKKRSRRRCPASTVSVPGIGSRSSLTDGDGRRPRIVDVDRIHENHDNADFDFTEANVRKDLFSEILERPLAPSSRPASVERGQSAILDAQQTARVPFSRSGEMPRAGPRPTVDENGGGGAGQPT